MAKVVFLDCGEWIHIKGLSIKIAAAIFPRRPVRVRSGDKGHKKFKGLTLDEREKMQALSADFERRAEISILKSFNVDLHKLPITAKSTNLEWTPFQDVIDLMPWPYDWFVFPQDIAKNVLILFKRRAYVETELIALKAAIAAREISGAIDRLGKLTKISADFHRVSASDATKYIEQTYPMIEVVRLDKVTTRNTESAVIEVNKSEVDTRLPIEHLTTIGATMNKKVLTLPLAEWVSLTDIELAVKNAACLLPANFIQPDHKYKDGGYTEVKDSVLFFKFADARNHAYQPHYDELARQVSSREIQAVDENNRPIKTLSCTHSGSVFIRRADAVAYVERCGFDVAGAMVETIASPEATPASDAPKTKSPEQRQAERYQMIIDEGLVPPRDTYGHMPRGVGKIARRLGITTQAFSEDVKKFIGRLNSQPK